MSDAIRAVIFDVGGVLVQTFDHSHRRRWEERLGLVPGEAEAIVLNSRMGRRAQLGEISDQELWEWVGQHLALGDDLERFRSDFWRGDRLEPGLVNLLRRLQPRYQAAVISNFTDALIPALTERYDIARHFDLIVVSAHEKVMKPDVAIYERTLERLGCAPEEAIFIDDSAANVAAARALEIWSIHYTPGLDVERELLDLGLTLEPA